MTVSVVGKAVPQQEIADRLGKPASWISRMNRLNGVSGKLQTLLLNDQIKTTTLLDKIDEYGEEEAEALIFAEIEAGKGQAAIDYQEAMAEFHDATGQVAHMLATGTGQEEVTTGRGGRRGLSPVAKQQRRVAKADTAAKRAKVQMERGPERITNRALSERKAAEAASRHAFTL